MQIQLNTSNGIENKENLDRWADTEIRQLFARFTADVTRIEVHLSDENHAAGGAGDKRCVMEARLAHLKPIAVTHDADDIDDAFRGAADKLKRALDSAIGRMNSHRDRQSIRKDDGAVVE